MKTHLLGKCILNKKQLEAQAKNVRKGLIDGVEILLELSHANKEQTVRALEREYAEWLGENFEHLSVEIGWTLDEKNSWDVLARDKKIRKRSRETLERTVEIMEKRSNGKVNVHLTGDMRPIYGKELPAYERDKKELLSEWKEYAKEIGKKHITFENVIPLEIPIPPGTYTMYHEIGKLHTDFIKLHGNTTLDIAHAGLTVKTFMDKEKQRILGTENQVRVNSYMGWKPVHYGKEEREMERKLEKWKPAYESRENKEMKEKYGKTSGMEKEKATAEVLHWLREIKKKGKLHQVHFNNCNYKNRLWKGKETDGQIEGDLDLMEIARAVKKVRPKYIVTEIKEERQDYIGLKNNKRVWKMIKNA